MRNQPIGANVQQTLVLKGPQTLADSLYQNTYQPFKSSVLQMPGVRNIAASTSVMGDEIYWTNSSRRLGSDQPALTLYNLGIDNDFIPAYGIVMAAGRNFSQSFETDRKAVILNKKATALLGFSSPARSHKSKDRAGTGYSHDSWRYS